MTVEGSQCHLAALKLEATERGVCYLPGQLERVVGGNAGQQVKQGGDGAAGGEHSDSVLRVMGVIEQSIEAALHALDKGQPAFQLGGVPSAAEPTRNNQIENALEFDRVMGGVGHRGHGVGFIRQQAGKQGFKHAECIEFIEGCVNFQCGPG